MNKFIPLCLTVMIFAAPHAAAAATGAEERAILHLIDYVRSANTTFDINGTAYSSGAAADHMAMKYRYVHNRIDTADQFIDYIASGNPLTAQPYTVNLTNGNEMVAEDWLRAELARYRGQ